MESILRRVLDALLLPLALVLVVLEEVLWAGLLAMLRWLADLPPLIRLAAWLGRLPGQAALPLFLVPEAVGKLGELWATALLLQGRIAAAVWVYVGVRVVALTVAVFIYKACQPALLSVRWFAAMVDWIRRAGLWARARWAPLATWARGVLDGPASLPVRRFVSIRRHLGGRRGGADVNPAGTARA